MSYDLRLHCLPQFESIGRFEPYYQISLMRKFYLSNLGCFAHYSNHIGSLWSHECGKGILQCLSQISHFLYLYWWSCCWWFTVRSSIQWWSCSWWYQLWMFSSCHSYAPYLSYFRVRHAHNLSEGCHQVLTSRWGRIGRIQAVTQLQSP